MASNGAQSSSPYLRYGFAGLLMAAVVTAILYWYLYLEVLYAWLLAISAVTFLFYGFDKLRAPTEGAERVPELVLLGLGLLGGTPAGLLGMIIFHHKTNKPSYKFKFVLTVLIQALAAYAWLNRQALFGDYL